MDDLERAISNAFFECGMGRNANLAEPIAAAVRTHILSDDVVATAALDIANFMGHRPWDNMADDRGKLRELIKSGYDINEPTKRDCIAAARATLRGI